MSNKQTPQWDGILSKLQSIKKRPAGVTSQEWEHILTKIKSMVKRKDAPFDPDRQRELIASKLAKWFVKGFFVILVIVLIYVPIYNVVMKLVIGSSENLLNVKDSFGMVVSYLGPLLGVVLGYYFKN